MGGRPYLLLLVDDDAVAAERLESVLREDGYDVAAADTAPAARAWLDERAPDLLIAAHRLVGTTGLDLIRHGRLKLPHLSCILLTDSPDSLLAAEARRQRIVLLDRRAPADRIRAIVAEALATTRRRQRWPRKRLTQPTTVTIDATAVRLLNVSYGGFGFLVPPPAAPPPPSFTVGVPTSGGMVAAELVWSRALPATGACQCGAAISGDPRSEEVWRAFVDGIS